MRALAQYPQPSAVAGAPVCCRRAIRLLARPAPSTAAPSARRGLRPLSYMQSSVGEGVGEQPVAAPAAAPTIPVRFEVTQRVEYGEHICVVGSDERLGGWEVGAAPRLAWREGHVWSAVVDVPADKPLEYKFVCCADWRPPIWEQLDNRCLTASEGLVGVRAMWNDPVCSLVTQLDEAAASLSDSEDLGPPAFASEVDALSASGTLDDDAPAELASVVTPDFPAGAAAGRQASLGGLAASGISAVLSAIAAPPAPTPDEEQEQTAEEEAEEQVAEEEAEASPEEQAAVGAAAAGQDLAAPAPAPAPERLVGPDGAPRGGTRLLRAVGKTAGAVAMGVAAGAVLSALAIDVTDMAVMGAMTAGVAGLALSGPKAGASAEGGEGGAADAVPPAAAGGRRRGAAGDAPEPGLLMAAGVLAAVDGAKKVLAPGEGEAGQQGPQQPSE